MHCPPVRPAGPGAPPARSGGEPRPDGASFGAVIDPLLATSAGATTPAAKAARDEDAQPRETPSDDEGPEDPTVAIAAPIVPPAERPRPSAGAADSSGLPGGAATTVAAGLDPAASGSTVAPGFTPSMDADTQPADMAAVEPPAEPAEVDASASEPPSGTAESAARSSDPSAAPASTPDPRRPGAAPASAGTSPDDAAAAQAREHATALDSHAGGASGAARPAEGLAAQLAAAHGTSASPETSSTGPSLQPSPEPTAAEDTAVGAGPVVPASAGETASGDGMDAAGFGVPNDAGSSGGDSSQASGSGHGTPAPTVPVVTQPSWTGWAAGHIPVSAGGTLGHAGATDDPVVPQLVKALHMQLRGGVGEARVQLEPHHLGAVSVTLRVENGVVSAVITAEQPAVRHWLETHESSLRGALSEQGLQLDRLRVDPDRHSGEHASTGHEPPPRRRMPRKETATFELVA